MNKKILPLIFLAILLAGGFYFFKKPAKSNTEENISTEEEKTQQSTEAATSAAVVSTDVTQAAPSTTTLPTANQEESLNEKYKKQGYIQDPNNQNQLMKTTVNKDGTTHIYFVDKADKGFEPDPRTIKNALEVLQSKRNINPFEEVRTLVRIDEKNFNSAIRS